MRRPSPVSPAIHLGADKPNLCDDFVQRRDVDAFFSVATMQAVVVGWVMCRRRNGDQRRQPS